MKTASGTRSFLMPVGIFVLACSLLPGCRHAREVEGSPSLKTLRGTVYVVGNEPFTSLAIQDSLGRMHKIHGPKDLETRLFQRQGKLVEVTIVDSTRRAEGPVLEIDGVAFPDDRPGTPVDSTGQ